MCTFFSSVGNAASYSSIFNPSPLLLPAPPTTHRTLHHTRTRVYRIRDACRLHATAREATAVCKTRVDPSSSPYFPAGNGVNNTEIYLFTGINHRELYGWAYITQIVALYQSAGVLPPRHPSARHLLPDYYVAAPLDLCHFFFFFLFFLFLFSSDSSSCSFVLASFEFHSALFCSLLGDRERFLRRERTRLINPWSTKGRRIYDTKELTGSFPRHGASFDETLAFSSSRVWWWESRSFCVGRNQGIWMPRVFSAWVRKGERNVFCENTWLSFFFSIVQLPISLFFYDWTMSTRQ